MTDMKLQDMKMADQIAGHENARHESLFYHNNEHKTIVYPQC